MWEGFRAGGNAHTGPGPQRQPAYSQHPSEQPDMEAQNEHEEPAERDPRGSVMWPFLFAVALLEVAWLVAVAYAIREFVSRVAG